MKKDEYPVFIGEEMLTKSKFLNMKVAAYRLPSGKVLEYHYVTRGKKKAAADAVRVVLYYEGDDGKTRVVLIRQFRYPAGKELYETVAGLVEEGQTLEETAIREAQEEVGAEGIEDLVMVDPPSYSSAGMSDEKVACFEARVKNLGKEQPEETEKLDRVVFTLDELENLLNSDAEFCLESRQQLRAFVYKHKYLDLKKSIESGKGQPGED